MIDSRRADSNRVPIFQQTLQLSLNSSMIVLSSKYQIERTKNILILMLNKFINQFKEKEQKKSSDNLAPVKELFNKEPFQLKSISLWKMNATQLEDFAKKQKNYIKHIKKTYTKLFDDFSPIIEKYKPLLAAHEELEKQLTNLKASQEQYLKLFDELAKQKETLEKQIQFLSKVENQQAPQIIQRDTGNLIDFNSGRDGETQKNNFDIFNLMSDNFSSSQQQQPPIQHQVSIEEQQIHKMKEELDKLQRQCQQVCEEMRRLQEDNNDLNLALEGEKIHKQSQISSLKQKLEETQQELNQLKSEREQQLSKLNFLESEKNTLQQEKSVSNVSLTKLEEEKMLKIKDLESRIVQERIKREQKEKDSDRFEEEKIVLKKQLEQQSQINNDLQAQLFQLESKRKKDKAAFQEYHQKKTSFINEIELVKAKLFLENESLKLSNERIQMVAEDYLIVILELQERQKILSQKEGVLNQKEGKFQEMSLEIEVKNKQIAELQNYVRERDWNKENDDKQIQQLQIKREYAKQEIKQLSQNCQQLNAILEQVRFSVQNNKSIVELKQFLEVNIAKSNAEMANQSEKINQKTTHKRKRVKVLNTLLRVAKDWKTLNEQAYKSYIEFLLEYNEFIQKDSKFNENFLKLDKKINDCNRRGQDFLDLFDDLGVK